MWWLEYEALYIGGVSCTRCCYYKSGFQETTLALSVALETQGAKVEDSRKL